jgi:hypothetical protein
MQYQIGFTTRLYHTLLFIYFEASFDSKMARRRLCGGLRGVRTAPLQPWQAEDIDAASGLKAGTTRNLMGSSQVLKAG